MSDMEKLSSLKVKENYLNKFLNSKKKLAIIIGIFTIILISLFIAL